jgi:hypothetical protein
MKIFFASALAAILPFSCTFAFHISTAHNLQKRSPPSALKNGLDLSGNTWKPDSGKMGSTDTGDYFPENYDGGIGFEEGMMGSQANKGGGNNGPQLPGMENLGADAIMVGGIEEHLDIPAGMQFIPSSVPDGEFQMSMAASSSARGK